MPLRFLIRDRYSPYTVALDAVFEADGATLIQTPRRAPLAPRALAGMTRIVARALAARGLPAVRQLPDGH
jgi:hypothetical protein